MPNIEWRRGELESLPIEDAAVDVALLSQALHHAAEPARALAEARRVLAPGGRLLVLDLRRHEEAWVRERLGDRWLGFDDEELAAMLKAAGFADVRVRVGARLPGDPFTVLIAAGRRGSEENAERGTRNAELAAELERNPGRCGVREPSGRVRSDTCPFRTPHSVLVPNSAFRIPRSEWNNS